MLLSSPVWRGDARWWFSGGLLLGGLSSAVVAMSLGSLLLRPFLQAIVAGALVTGVLLVVGANEFGLVRIPFPQNARQVPQWIADSGGAFGGLQFGFEMGTGARTYMTSGLPHVMLAGTLLVTTWPQAVLAGIAFGAGRAWMTWSRLSAPDSEEWDVTLARREALLRRTLTVAAAALLAAALIG